MGIVFNDGNASRAQDREHKCSQMTFVVSWYLNNTNGKQLFSSSYQLLRNLSSSKSPGDSVLCWSVLPLTTSMWPWAKQLTSSHCRGVATWHLCLPFLSPFPCPPKGTRVNENILNMPFKIKLRKHPLFLPARITDEIPVTGYLWKVIQRLCCELHIYICFMNTRVYIPFIIQHWPLQIDAEFWHGSTPWMTNAGQKRGLTPNHFILPFL